MKKSNSVIVLESLMKSGEYKLALRLVWMQYRVLRLHKAKLKHMRKWNKVARDMKELHNEIDIFAFKGEIDVVSAFGTDREEDLR